MTHNTTLAASATSNPIPIPSISAATLTDWIVSNKPLHILDVRRAPAFEKNPVLIAGAVRVLPDELASWLAGRDSSTAVVVYCVYGHEVSQNAAQLLLDCGFNACYLAGGITDWQAQRI